MSTTLPCWNCKAEIPIPPPQGIYCSQCGNYNGPITAGCSDFDITAPPVPALLIPDGSELTIELPSAPMHNGEPITNDDQPEAQLAAEAVQGGMSIKGRGFSSPVVKVSILCNRVIIRVDDGVNPEAWLDIGMTADFVKRLNDDLENANKEPGDDD